MAKSNNNISPPQFNISAAVVRQLGEELVTDEVTAIMELVKNSYDADATWVRIVVNPKQSLEGSEFHYKNDRGHILIEDNGFGMNEEEITNGWMVISLSVKRKMKAIGEKTPLGRTPLGDKGLGRLSTQRLGSRLEMFTTKESDEKVNHVAFDWNDFTENLALTDVPTYFDKLPKTSKQGTKLVIRNLKDPFAWEDKAADKFIGQLSQLIFPFKEKREFNVFLTINNERIDLDELNEALRSQAVSKFSFKYEYEKLHISGAIKSYKLYGGSPSISDKDAYQSLISLDSGKNFFEFLTDKQNNRSNFIDNISYSGKNGILFTFDRVFDVKLVPEIAYITSHEDELILADPGSFWGEIDDFNLREAETLDSTFDNFSQYKEIVKNQIGVRIFRNGFGIKPFGINGEDWLKLGSQQTSGGSYYTLRPSNTIGFIALTAEHNKNLKEKTDREGFMESPYSKNFFLLTGKIVSEINSFLEKTRRSYNEYKRHVAQQSGNINDIKESYTRLEQTSKSAATVQKNSQKISTSLHIVSSAVKAVIAKSQGIQLEKPSENNLDLLIDIDKLLDDANQVLSQVDTIMDVAKKLENDANYIRPKVQDLENQLSEFAELAGLGLTAEALSHEISNIVDNLLLQTNTIAIHLKGQKNLELRAINIYVEYVKSAIQSFRKQLSHLAPSLRYVRDRREEFNMSTYLNELCSFYSDKFKDKIYLELIIEKDFKINVSKGKLTQILDNVILNSEYWLREKSRIDKKFNPTLTIRVDKGVIRISDNGYGVDPAYEERIFQPFVTSKPKGIGRGLGLFIVQQLLDTIGGEILLLNERNAESRRYIFQINFSSITI